MTKQPRQLRAIDRFEKDRTQGQSIEDRLDSCPRHRQMWGAVWLGKTRNLSSVESPSEQLFKNNLGIFESVPNGTRLGLDAASMAATEVK